MPLSLRMNFREATVTDIPQIQRVRNAVKENVLSDPALVSDTDCIDYITRRGKGWVCEADGKKLLAFPLPILLEITFGHYLLTRITKAAASAKNFIA